VQAEQSVQSEHVHFSQQQLLHEQFALLDFLFRLVAAKTVAPASISVAQMPKITFFIL
jgi:hypothetical protein